MYPISTGAVSVRVTVHRFCIMVSFWASVSA
jgi:hypothetical protein